MIHFLDGVRSFMATALAWLSEMSFLQELIKLLFQEDAFAFTMNQGIPSDR